MDNQATMTSIVVDTDDAYEFSDNFHKAATKNQGINLILKDKNCYVVSADITDLAFKPEEHAYCCFRCYRDAQTFCVVRGWIIKEVFTVKSLFQ